MKGTRTFSPIGEVFAFFLRLGLTAFGGPAAHIALMERDAVARRWLSRDEFLDLVGACNLLPGPSSTQVAMALGYRRAKVTGLVVAGVCFILPASVATLALAWAYVHYGSLPQATGLLFGAKPVMVAIVLQAVWSLGKSAVRGWGPALLGLVCLAAALSGVYPIVVLLAAGGISMIPSLTKDNRRAVLSATFPGGVAGAAVEGAPGLATIALVFLKLGVVVFGSGYILLAFLKADLVDRLHWITVRQLLDAVTAGQLTPGPVFATSTFIGYLVRGWAGAAVATLAVFLPSFFMAAAIGALAGQIRKSKLAAAFLDGVNVAAVALMAEIAIVLGRATLVDAPTWGISLLSAVFLIRFRANATWLIAAGAAIGILLRGLR